MLVFVKFSRVYLRKLSGTNGINVVLEVSVVEVSLYQRFGLVSSGLICSVATGGVAGSEAVL